MKTLLETLERVLLMADRGACETCNLDEYTKNEIDCNALQAALPQALDLIEQCEGALKDAEGCWPYDCADAGQEGAYSSVKKAPRPVSGFPEWLPEVRAVEQQWFDHIRRVFESYGFCSIETPSVEELDVISAKGEADKEIYVIERLHKEEGDSREARLALHFDQTVPLARYTAQHFNDLVFPFKRYQMQRVWRGERPQAGRFREFYQCDIDVINIDSLPLHFDAEMPAIMYEVMKGLPGMENENIQIQVSNRKILVGLLEGLGIADPAPVTREIDKLEKIGKDAVEENLKAKGGLDAAQVKAVLSFVLDGQKPQAMPEKMEEGFRELDFVMGQLSHLPPGAVKADLSMVRGLDYYTGTVYETVFTDNPNYGSICSGGRYDDLASSYINKKLPGVGISIGFSRLFAYLLEQGRLPVGRKSPAHVLMALPSEEDRAIAAEAARILRRRGFNVEMFHAAKKFGDQIKYADRKGIPYVWFPGQPHKVKDIVSGEQADATPENWTPAALQRQTAAVGVCSLKETTADYLRSLDKNHTLGTIRGMGAGEIAYAIIDHLHATGRLK